jgi:hypothetical protein
MDMYILVVSWKFANDADNLIFVGAEVSFHAYLPQIPRPDRRKSL